MSSNPQNCSPRAVFLVQFTRLMGCDCVGIILLCEYFARYCNNLEIVVNSNALIIFGVRHVQSSQRSTRSE